ncbi:glycerophosphodiester phosphodiesterase family protein, partial [Rhizobium ruizarguesonis]
MTNAAWIRDLPVAHRGYHDLNTHIWENTLSAFSRAVEAGFAIECDLHYASDGVPVIFHDEDLQRLCNLNGDIRERTSRELGLIAVGGTSDKVPTLRQLLDLVKGKVPLVLELKGREADDEG